VALAAKLWGSVESPVAKLRAYERRRWEKIAELEARMAAFETALQERMAAFETALQERIVGLEVALRERMTALETVLQKCPGEACLYCGERTLRLKKASGIMGSGRGSWRRESWVCEACGREDWRHRNYPD
jgi:hypothetical protein